MHLYLRINRQRPSGSRALCLSRRERTSPLAWLLALLLISAASLLYALPARSDENVVIDAGGDLESEDVGRGMPSSNPRVKPILAAHPNQLVVVCIAGCNGKPKAVQVPPHTVAGRVAEFVPSKGKMGHDVYGPPRPGKSLNRLAGIDDDVICLAGCNGRPGQVLQRLPDLPPPEKVKAKATPKKRDGLLDILP